MSRSAREADRHSRFDHERRIGCCLRGGGNHTLHRRGIEALRDRVVVGGRGDDHHLGAGVGGCGIGGGPQIERAVFEPLGKFRVFNGTLAAIDLRHSRSIHIEPDHGMPRRKQRGAREADAAQPHHDELHAPDSGTTSANSTRTIDGRPSRFTSTWARASPSCIWKTPSIPEKCSPTMRTDCPCTKRY